jgi:rod shape-determining protein MreC
MCEAADTMMGVRDTRRTRRYLVVLLAAALALVAFGYVDGSSPVLRGVRHVSGSVFGGIEHAGSSVAGFFGGSSSSGQVHQLQQQVVQLRAELSQAQLNKTQYRQLHQLLLLAGTGRYRIAAASVIAIGQGYQQTVTLDAGSADGVKPDETVLDGQGLVGQVTAVTSTTSTVLLATGASSVVGVSLSPSGELGKVTGPGTTGTGPSGMLTLQVFDTSAALHVGEAMVTSASINDQPFVPGVPVGVIYKIINKAGSLTPTALVKPYADFAALGVVGIVIGPPARSPRFSVLPPIPHPAPAITVTVTPKPSVSPSPSASG